MVAIYLCYFVTRTSPRNDSDKQSWWMSDDKSSLSFFVVYRDRLGGDVRLGKVACESMQVLRFFCVCGCFTMFPRVWTLGCRVGERRTGGRSKEVAQCMVAPPLASAGWRDPRCGQLSRVQDDAEVAEPPELVGRLGGPAHLVCPRPADRRAQG